MPETRTQAELLAEIDALRRENSALKAQLNAEGVDAFLRALLDDVEGISVQGYHADGTIIYWNRASEAIYGYTAAEALGRDLVELIIPEPMRPMVRSLIAGAAVTGQMPPPEELALLHKDGSPVPVLSSHSVVILEGMEPLLFCMDVDLAPLKKAEKDLKRSLQEKDLLLREVHHRVKNNLQVISGLLDLSGRRVSSEEARALCRDLGTKIISMTMVHNQLYQSEHLDEIDVAEHVRKLWTHLTGLFSARNVEAVMQMDDVCLPVSVALPLGLVVGELATNVLNHAFPGGRAGRVVFSLAEQGGEVVFSIRDDGAGFDPHAVDQSASLGLKLVRSIVSYQLRGGIDIDSGRGTLVSLRFPKSPRD